MKFIARKFSAAKFLAFLVIVAITFSNTAKASSNLSKTPDNLGLFQIADFDENNIVLYQITLANGIIISDSISGYLHKNQLFLSLAEFAGAVEFAIKVDEDGTRASGWFLDESHNFSLDLNQRLSISKNKQFILANNSIIKNQNEIYVNIKLLQQWFPLKMSANPLDQIITVQANEPLPIELKLEREQKWQTVKQEDDLKEQEKIKDLNNPTIRTPYQAANLPLSDIRYGYSYNNPKTGTINRRSQLDALLSGDLLYLNNQLFLSASNDGGISSARITSGRKDPEGKLLGPMKATSFSLGDVFTPQLPLISRPQIGRGAAVSNFPEGFIIQFDNIPIIGNAQPGWDVELYRNDSLLGFLTVPSSGIYEFKNVLLVSGVNIIKLKFYGPYGQKREETYKYYMNENIVKENQLLYNFSANQNNTSLINIPNQDEQNNPKDGANRYFGEAIYGLTKTTSLGLNFSQLPLDNTGKENSYVGASVRSSIFGIFGRFDLVRDLESKANATGTSLQTRIFDFDITGKFDKYDKEFISEEKQVNENPLLSKTTLRIDGSFKIPKIPPIRTSTVFIEQHFDSNKDQYNFTQEFATNVGKRLNITQNFNHILDQAITDETRVTETGATILNFRATEKLSLRGLINYNFKPNTELSSSTATSDFRFKNDYTLNLNATHQFQTSNQKSSNVYTVNLNKIFESFIASIGGNYGNQTGYGINMNLSTSFGYDAKYKVGNISPTPIANNGAISARTFIDNNNNDTYDKGDELLPGVKFSVEGASSKNATNENGAILVTGVQPVSKISINPESLEDPSWVSKRSKVTVISHAGGIVNIEYPIIPTGEIDGVVLINNGSQDVGASNVVIELVSDRGILTKSATTSFDGYYLISGVPFGNYKLRVSNDQLERLGLGVNTSHRIRMDVNNISSTGYNFKIGKGVLNKSEEKKPSVKFKIKNMDQEDGLAPEESELETPEEINAKEKSFKFNEKIFKPKKKEKKMILTPLDAPEVKFKIKEGSAQVKDLNDITPKDNKKKDYIFKKSATEKTADEINHQEVKIKEIKNTEMKKYKIQTLEKETVKINQAKKFNVKNIERKPAISVKNEKTKTQKDSKKSSEKNPAKEKKKVSKKAESKEKYIEKSDKKTTGKEDKKKKSNTREHSAIIDPSTLN